MNHARAALAAFGAGLVTLALPVLADEDLDQIIVTGARAPLSIAAAGSAVRQRRADGSEIGTPVPLGETRRDRTSMRRNT